MNSLHVEIPMPVAAISKNGSHGTWHKQQELFQQAKTDAYNCIVNVRNNSPCQLPWTGPVVVLVRWYARSRPFPDFDNMVARLAPAMDAAQAANLFGNDNQIVGQVLIHAGLSKEPRVALTFGFMTVDTWNAFMAPLRAKIEGSVCLGSSQIGMATVGH